MLRDPISSTVTFGICTVLPSSTQLSSGQRVLIWWVLAQYEYRLAVWEWVLALTALHQLVCRRVWLTITTYLGDPDPDFRTPGTDFPNLQLSLLAACPFRTVAHNDELKDTVRHIYLPIGGAAGQGDRSEREAGKQVQRRQRETRPIRRLPVPPRSLVRPRC